MSLIELLCEDGEEKCEKLENNLKIIDSPRF